MMPDAYSIVPLSPLRKVIAARMSEAKRTIPHFRLVKNIDVGALLALRARVHSENPDCRVSVNDCIIKACAITLVQHPAVNVQLVGDELHHYRDVDISVVVAVTGGLLTPVLRLSNQKSVNVIAQEMRILAERARTRQLRMEEITGGTFSISNLGFYGVDQFDAIINPPQCAILAVGRFRSQTEPSPDGTAGSTTMLTATLSVDHRAIDGVTGALFMKTLSEVIEEPSALFD